MKKEDSSGIITINDTTKVIFGGKIGFATGDTENLLNEDNYKLLCLFETNKFYNYDENPKNDYSPKKPQVHLLFSNEESINILIGALELLKKNINKKDDNI